MSAHRSSLAGGRRRALIALGVAGALALAACGGSSSQAPSDDAAGTTDPGAPIATDVPDSTVAPTDPVDAGDGGDAFSAAAAALDTLDSYAFRVELDSVTVSGTTTTTSHSVYAGIVVNRPTKANQLQISELDADGNVTSGTEFIVIGEEAWLKDVADTAWTAMPAAQMGGFFSSFRPEQMFATYFAGIGSSFGKGESESKNGIDSTHYQGDESIGQLLGMITGFAGSWHSDVWIANDGGFLVHSEAGAEASAGPEAGKFLIVVDITDPNSAGPVEPPA